MLFDRIVVFLVDHGQTPAFVLLALASPEQVR